MRATTVGRCSISVLGSLLLACSVKGEDVATTFFDPTANPSGMPPATGDTSDTDAPATGGDSEPAGEETATTGATTDPGATGTTGSPPVDEQPEDGMYSACTTVVDCIGQTTCVLVPGAPMGFCSSTGCATPGTDCQPNPGATSTATPTCVDDGGGAQVCALGCAGSQTCPGGMECLPLGASVVCV